MNLKSSIDNSILFSIVEKMNNSIIINKKLFQYLILYTFLYLLGSCTREPLNHYPNGTVLENISWRVALKDSLNILKMKDGVWLLPKAKGTSKYVKSYTYYKKPGKTKYEDQLGKIDQQEFNSNDTDIVRFYRFSHKGLMLVGYSARNTAKPLSIFDPPVVIQPANLTEHLTSNSLLKTWNKNKFNHGMKTKVAYTPKKTGYYLNDAAQKRKGTLYELTITEDASVQYGGHNLIVPDVVSISSNILADNNGQLVLEWGIRKEPQEKLKVGKQSMPDSLYIEVTKYEIVK